jgi:hypothetical protein
VSVGRQGKKAVGVVRGAAERTGIKERDVAGQILARRAEAVGEPGAKAGLARLHVAGMELVAGGRVVVTVGLERMDETQFIHVLASSGKSSETHIPL